MVKVIVGHFRDSSLVYLFICLSMSTCILSSVAIVMYLFVLYIYVYLHIIFCGDSHIFICFIYLCLLAYYLLWR